MKLAPGLVVAALLFNACSDEPSTEGDEGELSPSTSSTGVEPQPEADDAFERALEQFVADGRGGFSSSAMLPGDLPLTQEGTYDVENGAGRLRATWGVPGEGLVFDSLSNRNAGWIRLYEPLEWPCWVHLGGGNAGETLDQAFEGMTLSGPPAAIAVITYGAGESWEGDDIVGTSDLALTASALSGKVVSGLGIPPDSDARVPVTFELEDGQLVGWRATMLDIVDAARSAGYGMGELPVPSDHSDREQLYGRVVLEVELDQARGADDLTPPGPDDVIELLPRESYEARMRACG